MYITKLEIKSFGLLIDKTIDLSDGLNIIEGKNESGKSSVAMFIKFMFYGLSAKAVGADTVSERDLYINWDTGIAAGEVYLNAENIPYRIERRLTKSCDPVGKDSYHESIRIINLETGEAARGVKNPGEFFFGFPEKVFMQSAFVKNTDSAKIDGAGLKVALENLLTSGDEEINTKKALERLDGVRKLLLHKNGTGGKIGELFCEKRELDEMLEASKDVSAEIVSLEGTLADIEVKASRREKEYAEYSALCRAYEAVRIGARVKEIEICEGNIDFLKSELDSLNPEINRSLLAKIELCDASVRETEEDLKTLSEKRKILEEKCEGRDLEEPEEGDTVVKGASKVKGLRLFSLAMACSLSAFALVMAAAFFILRGAAAGLMGNYFIPFVVAGSLFFVFGAGGFVLYHIFTKKWLEILNKWDVDDVYELENAVISQKEKYKYTKKLLDNISSIDDMSDRAVDKHDREVDNGFAIGAALGIEGCETVYEVLEKAREVAGEICDRRDTMTVKLESAKGRLSALLEEVGEAERYGAEEAERAALEDLDREKILAMTKEDYARALKERDFADSSSRAMRQREADIKAKLSALNAAGKSPSEIAGRISLLEKEIAELSFKHRAFVTAYTALEKAGEKMRGDVMPHVVEQASRVMGLVTGGRYESLSAGESLELSFVSRDEKRSVEYLSQGTRDASYISVRVALVNVMYKDRTPTMIFDECFARMDADRLAGILYILNGENVPQSIVFTCRSLEGKVAPDANIIVL